MTETGGFQFGGIWVVYVGTAEICTTIPDVCSRFVEQNLFVFTKCHEIPQNLGRCQMSIFVMFVFCIQPC